VSAIVAAPGSADSRRVETDVGPPSAPGDHPGDEYRARCGPAGSDL